MFKVMSSNAILAMKRKHRFVIMPASLVPRPFSKFSTDSTQSVNKEEEASTASDPPPLYEYSAPVDNYHNFLST